MYRKGVSAIIINNQDQILLVNLVAFEHHFFDIPGGGLERGETLEQAVYREVEEELGINQSQLELKGISKEPLRFTFKGDPLIRDGITYTGQERTFFALRFMGAESDIELNEDEIRKYIWCNYNDLGNYLLFENQLEDTQMMIRGIVPNIVPSVFWTVCPWRIKYISIPYLVVYLLLS